MHFATDAARRLLSFNFILRIPNFSGFLFGGLLVGALAGIYLGPFDFKSIDSSAGAASKKGKNLPGRTGSKEPTVVWIQNEMQI